MAGYVGILEGYQPVPRGKRMRRRGGRGGRRAAMKACAVRYKVTSRSFHACVRKKTGGKKRR